LTGVEAISNGVPAFKQPEPKNAAVTLLWMAGLLGVMFMGTSVLAYLYGVHPRENETVISQFARIMFTGGLGWFYYVVQATTAAILVLAANTSLQTFHASVHCLRKTAFCRASSHIAATVSPSRTASLFWRFFPPFSSLSLTATRAG
jgi:hypothetical protein